MKRSRDPSSSNTKATKRSKSVQACTSCRKHKTRCEVLDTTAAAIRCHRCKTLDVPCSYEEMDKSILIQNASKTQRETYTTTPAERGQDVFDKWALGIEKSPAPTLRRNVSKPHDIWTFLRVQYGELDWTAPLEAIKIITKNPATFTPSSVASIPNDCLENILTTTQVNDLLVIFSKHYEPWLNFTLMRSTDSPLLDLVCCTIAARHLEDATVAPRLYTLTQDNSAKLIFQSRRSEESLEAIQCLLILSLWAPLSGEFGDGRLLIASAISIAMDLRLNEAPGKALALLNCQRDGETVNETHLLEMMNKSRLWISLSNAESLLCIGSGREALSKRDAEYIQLFGLCESLPTDKIGGRDTRLRFLADIYEYTEKGFGIKFVSDSEADVIDWYRANETIRKEFGHIQRLVLPLGVVAEDEKFQFQMILVMLQCCRLLSLYHAMVVARMFYKNPHANWFGAVRPYNENVLLVYGKECLALAESILVHFLETDVGVVGTCPDQIFLMISFAASFVVGVKFMLVEGIGRLLPGSSNTILSMCIGHLRGAASSAEHPANQSATVVGMLVGLWENKESVIRQSREMEDDLSWLNDPSFWNGILDTTYSYSSA